MNINKIKVYCRLEKQNQLIICFWLIMVLRVQLQYSYITIIEELEIVEKIHFIHNGFN